MFSLAFENLFTNRDFIETSLVAFSLLNKTHKDSHQFPSHKIVTITAHKFTNSSFGYQKHSPLIAEKKSVQFDLLLKEGPISKNIRAQGYRPVSNLTHRNNPAVMKEKTSLGNLMCACSIT